jgi:hypothetical protein
MRSSFVRSLALLTVVGCQDADSDTTDTTDTSDTDDPGDVGVVWLTDANPVDLTPDGATALVQDLTSLEAAIQLVNVADGATTDLTTLGDATRDMATGLSADLEVTALYGVPVEAGWWDGDSWQTLASPYATGCDQDHGGAWDLSDNGDVVVGLMWDGCAPLAFRWTAEDGVVPLETIGAPQDGSGAAHAVNRASVVSGDGQVAAGFASSALADRTPAMWTADGEGILLDPDHLDTPGEVFAIDGDGTTLAGQRGQDGFVWTEAGGFVDVPRTDNALPADPVFPNAITRDGGLVFGGVGSEFFGVPTAFVWSEAHGTRALQPLVEAAGVELAEGDWLATVLASSADGTVLAGIGFDAAFTRRTFLIRVPTGAFD